MTPSFNYGVSIVAYNTYKHHRINFTFPQHEFTIRQIIIYPSVYRQFHLCITNASGKAHAPKDARARPKGQIVKQVQHQKTLQKEKATPSIF